MIVKLIDVTLRKNSKEWRKNQNTTIWNFNNKLTEDNIEE